MLFLKALALVFLSILPSTLSVAIPDTIPGCVAPTVVSEEYIGEDHNVKTQLIQCANTIHSRDLAKRQSNVCGATCDTVCFTPSGGGPNPNECHVITDALLYASQNTGTTFNLVPANGTSVITMQYGSCLTFMVDQAGAPLQYCRSDWAAVLDWVAFNCQSTQNAHGGDCIARDQRWFIQVQHS